MTKYRVVFYEAVYTIVEVDAENLKEATHKVEAYREDAGKILEEAKTEELTATIYHSKGDKELKLI